MRCAVRVIALFRSPMTVLREPMSEQIYDEVIHTLLTVAAASSG